MNDILNEVGKEGAQPSELIVYGEFLTHGDWKASMNSESAKMQALQVFVHSLFHSPVLFDPLALQNLATSVVSVTVNGIIISTSDNLPFFEVTFHDGIITLCLPPGTIRIEPDGSSMFVDGSQITSSAMLGEGLTGLGLDSAHAGRRAVSEVLASALSRIAMFLKSRSPTIELSTGIKIISLAISTQREKSQLNADAGASASHAVPIFQAANRF